MAKSWLIDGTTIATSIKTCGLHTEHQVIDHSKVYLECPQCSCRIDKCNENEWPGLPAGVKFDPSEVELLEHLAAKCGAGNEKPHEFIDLFIPTLDEKEGICYIHPENLPGARKDGTGFHFFYRTTNAYTKGQRKRRRICDTSGLTTDVRWHKTGNTKAIFKNGQHLGFKKILVLYKDADGDPKSCHWVMHQYHLGTNKDEKDGDYVVSKIIFQAKKQTENVVSTVVEKSDAMMSLTTPTTPIANAPDPPRPGKTPLYEDVSGDYVIQSPNQDAEYFEQKYLPSFSNPENDSQAIDCTAGAAVNIGPGTTCFENLDMDSPPDFCIADLYFPPEDSYCGSLDWL
uniref:SUPPRESSOR OF GAMMA RESPONSE 1-like n=1 Tax=Erigeron canadensis TaxID=72917 RepID=UPI001CB92C1B|nr:SUPPRESSOR OF GAMMA RESPONSE 1-like [Erigeron canadensis]